MALSKYGKLVAEEWEKSTSILEEIELDEYVVMPNHFHAIVHIIPRTDHPQTFHSPSRSLGALVRGFKSSVTVRINELRNAPATPVWQRNYFDRVIRSDREYEQVAAYIANNPVNWLTDDENTPSGC